MRKKIPPVVTLALILALIASAVVWTIQYKQPILRTAQLEVFNSEGNSAQIQLNLLLYRSFFAPDRVDGTMAFQGEIYVYRKEASLGFWEGLSYKWRGLTGPTIFVNQKNLGQGVSQLMHDAIRLDAIPLGPGKTISSVSFLHMTEFWKSEP